MANKERKELARLYFMRGETQKSIANKVGVTEKTVSRWVDKEGWAEKRAAENITRPELVNKLLITINKLIEQVNESDDPDLISGLGDKLSKLSTTIEKLDKKANVVDAIEVFMAFGKWMQYRSSFDSEITPELLKAINKYQDLYISEQISKKS
ncbi:MAG: helix-turn-helix domain-containing protein [Clostridiaceae bacterium]|jgi:DNA-binding XRE family transcriptional regulator|nr:helix-turn-helix domain-containing protein [Clostridiaceae bacterium]